MEQPIPDPAWEFQTSVDCNASRHFVWSYWTNIANWDDPPATFHLDGPFSVGSRLTTSLPGQTLQSVIRDLKTDREATIEMQLPNAILSFHWMFESISEHGTRMTQRLLLSGENAKSFVAQASVLEQTAPQGMIKLAAAIERAHHATKEG
ncbi:MAG TPA: hypothetical protein VNW47_05330 [Terriglobales bacterium]|jgi:hypothetical protein|nr:hypothetical protein [Terriglobales bacterium]